MVVTSVLAVRWFLANQLRMLARDHDVTLLVRMDHPEEMAALELPVRTIEIPIMRKISPVADLRALWALYTVFRRERFDIVHTVTPKAGLLGIVAGFLARIPVRIHTFQGELWAHRKGVMRQILRGLDMLIARLATHLTIVSRTERQFLEDNGVLPHGKAQVLGEGTICGVNLGRFTLATGQRQEARLRLRLDEADQVFLFLGRLCADKGLPALAEATARLLPSRPRLRLLVVGPDEEDMLAQLTSRFGERSGAVQIHPFTRTPEDYIAAADVLVLPSLREGFGMVILEAGAMAVPSIGSDIYGIRDAIVDGETGLLFPPQDVEALALTMERLIDEPELRSRLGAAAKARVVRDFAEDKVIAALEQFYRSLPVGEGL
jgi:glycosyltransferase involved in cell wall biosynthesis